MVKVCRIRCSHQLKHKQRGNSTELRFYMFPLNCTSIQCKHRFEYIIAIENTQKTNNHKEFWPNEWPKRSNAKLWTDIKAWCCMCAKVFFLLLIKSSFTFFNSISIAFFTLSMHLNAALFIESNS